MPNPGHLGFCELLDQGKLRPVHFRLWLLSTGGTMFDGFSLFTLGVSLPLIIPEFNLNPTLVGLIGAAFVLGAVAGGYLGGHLADRLGRKLPYLIDMALLAVAALLAALAWNAYTILTCQLLIGFAIGIDFPVSHTYVAEFMPRDKRHQLLVGTITFQAVGMLLATIVTVSILEMYQAESAWRIFYVVLAVLAMVIFLLRLTLPESPRWHMCKGQNEKAAQVLCLLLPEHEEKIREMEAAAGTEVHCEAKNPQDSRSLGMRSLFSPEYSKRTMLACLPWFLMDIATYGIGLFTPLILGSIHLSGQIKGPTGVVGTVGADLVDAMGSGLIDSFLLVGFLIGLFVVPWFGHIKMQIVGFVGMAAGMLILLTATVLSGGASGNVFLVFAGFILFNLMMNMGPNSTTFTLPAELFPTQVRASGSGLAASFAKLGATLGIFFLPTIHHFFGITTVLLLMVIVSVLGFVVTLVFAKETNEVSL